MKSHLQIDLFLMTQLVERVSKTKLLSDSNFNQIICTFVHLVIYTLRAFKSRYQYYHLCALGSV